MIFLQGQNKKISKHSETLDDTNCFNVCLTQGKAFQKCVSYGDINNNFNQTILHEQ